jgi:hypothetical protein
MGGGGGQHDVGLLDDPSAIRRLGRLDLTMQPTCGGDGICPGRRRCSAHERVALQVEIDIASLTPFQRERSNAHGSRGLPYDVVRNTGAIGAGGATPQAAVPGESADR